MIFFVVEILMVLIGYYIGEIYGWNLGMYVQLIMLPAVVAHHWGYLFFDGNEMGSFLTRFAAERKMAVRDDSSNPLYVKGYFRKNYKKNPDSKMAKLKGHYFCQIVAIIQMMVMVIRIIYIIIFWKKYLQPKPPFALIWPDLLIMIWILLNRFLSLAFTEYYMSVFKQEKMKNMINAAAEQKDSDICITVFPNDNYEVLFYRDSQESVLKMHEIREIFAKQYIGGKEIFSGKKVGEHKGELMFTAVEDMKNGKTQILIQYYKSRLEKEDIYELNRAIHEELNSKHISVESLCITYIIFVEETSNTFIDLFCGEIEQREDCFRLPIGLVLNSGELYISGMKNEYGYEDYQIMKNTILEILKYVSREDAI